VALWDEGLATYVSDWATPHASPESLLLDIPKGMVPTCLANLRFLVDDLASKLDSKELADYGDYFMFRSKDPRRPKRAGYYLGYLLAKELHARMSMDALLNLEGAPLRNALAATLPTLASEDPRSR
jgi:hypothetical protein